MLLQCFNLIWAFVLVHSESEFILDSDQIYGLREPDGFAREEFSCPSDYSIVITSAAYGYKVLSNIHQILIAPILLISCLF